jgi:L-ascorbate metabolism protein UlaG (beta-lactamase superfamily)
MKVCFYGHACFGVEVSGKSLLFDPFISGNELAKDVDINSIPADYILLSHGHEDHVADAQAIAERTGATIVSGYECVNWFGAKGIKNIHPMNHGGSWNFDFGKVKYVNAIHSNSMPDGSYGGHPGGFVIDTSEGNFYFAGDTALTYDMKLIGESHKLNFAMLPIGDNFTMGVDDAVIAADFINCQKIIGMHFDTFGFIVVDHEAAKRKFADAGKELVLMKIGEGSDFI